MKISKKEKKMLYALGLIICAFLYYQFGYTALNKMVDDKTKNKEKVQQKYESAKNTVESMETQKAKVKILNEKISNQTEPFYPVISQEHIILEIDNLIKKSGLEGGMTFKDIEVKSVGALKKSDKDKDLQDSSIEPIADEYKNKYGTSQEKTEVKGSSSSSNTKNNSSADSSSNSTTTNTNSNNKSTTSQNDSNATNNKTENTVSQIQLNVDFNGTYAQVNKFLELLRTYERKMPAYAINMSTKNLNEVKGSVNMMIYAIPKIDDDYENYLLWELNHTYGKDKPFTVDSASGTGIKSNTSNGDFLIRANSINSSLPTVIMGKANDILRTTYAYADSNTEAGAELVLTKNGDKYYYKYKTNYDSIPKDYSGNGNEFVPNGDNIEINIQSESRTDIDDKAGLKLNVVNNTDKLANINISGDDKSDPRVSIDGSSKNINVNQK